jgi:RNA 3'-terminal phosphate cyclase
LAEVEALLGDAARQAGSIKESVTYSQCRTRARGKPSPGSVHKVVKKADAVLTYLSRVADLRKRVNKVAPKLVCQLADHMCYEKLTSKYGKR